MISRFFSSWCGHILFNLTEVFTFLVLGMISDFLLCCRYLEYDCILDHIPGFLGGSLCCVVATTPGGCVCVSSVSCWALLTQLWQKWCADSHCLLVDEWDASTAFPTALLSPSQWNCDTNLWLFQSKIILSYCIVENIISH